MFCPQELSVFTKKKVTYQVRFTAQLYAIKKPQASLFCFSVCFWWPFIKCGCTKVNSRGISASFSTYLSFEETHFTVRTDRKQGVYNRMSRVTLSSHGLSVCISKHAEVFTVGCIFSLVLKTWIMAGMQASKRTKDSFRVEIKTLISVNLVPCNNV